MTALAAKPDPRLLKVIEEIVVVIKESDDLSFIAGLCRANSIINNHIPDLKDEQS